MLGLRKILMSVSEKVPGRFGDVICNIQQINSGSLFKLRVLASQQLISRTFANKRISKDDQLGKLVTLASAKFERHIDPAKSAHPIVILHDLLGNKEQWSSIAIQLNRRLGRRVYTVDTRNHGDSPHSNHFNYEYMSCDLIFWMRAQELRKFTLVGHSVGGRIGMILAMRYPDLVQSMVVIDMSPVSVNNDMLATKKLLKDLKGLYLDRDYTLKEARKQAAIQLREKKYSNQMIELLLTNMVENEFHTNWMWKFNLDTILKKFDKEVCYFPIVNSPCETRTLFLGGGNSDYIIPQEEKDIKKLFHCAEFQYIPGAGHFIHLDKPVDFLDAVVDFIDKDPNKLQEEAERHPLGRPIDMAFQKYDAKRDESKPDIPIIIMHGLLGSKQNWHSLANQLNQKLGRTIYTVDARNHGDSPHAWLFSYELMLNDVLKFLHQHKLSKVTLIGHSMGGRTAMLVALMYPVLVESLIVVDMSPGKNSPNMVGIKQLLDDIKNLNLDPELTVQEARKQAAAQLKNKVKDERVIAFILTNLVENKGGKFVKGNWRWKFYLDSIIHNLESEIFAFPAWVLNRPTRTLFIGGANSDYLTPDDEANTKKFFPKAMFQYIEGAGHWVHAEKPKEFLSIATKFLAKDPVKTDKETEE